MIGILSGEPRHRFQCSRAGCEAEAVWAIEWRNPKIHAEDRRKTWLACEEHREYLFSFLNDRGFPIEVRTIEQQEDES